MCVFVLCCFLLLVDVAKKKQGCWDSVMASLVVASVWDFPVVCVHECAHVCACGCVFVYNLQ